MAGATKLQSDTLQLKSKLEAVAPENNVPSKALRHIITEEQLQAMKAHKTGLESYLLAAGVGVCIGSATGSLSALGSFLKTGSLSLEGFIQNICFFSSALAAIILLVIYLPKRNDFARLVAQVRSRSES